MNGRDDAGHGGEAAVAAAAAAPLWVLLGERRGDNAQLLAIAESTGVPFRVVPLRHHKRWSRPAPARWFAQRLTWKSEVPLAAPWPRAVLACGRKAVPAALWIRRASGDRTRLVHVNRPWSPLRWFDLVVTTPQYALPARPNVLAHLLPFVPERAAAPPLPASFAERAKALPRPWTVVLVGGDSRPLVLDAAAATRLGALAEAEVRRHGGSAWILDSPRTPKGALAAIESVLQVPSQTVRYGVDESCYAALLGLADRFVVTADSASMLTEALLTGQPVTPSPLTVKADWRWRWGAAWRAAAARSPNAWHARLLDRLLGLGLFASVRDLGLLLRALEQASLFEGQGRAPALALREREETIARVRAVLDAPWPEG